MKILVIEDHTTQLKLAHHVLAAAGNEVTDAAAAEQAFNSFLQQLPDIILLDLGLPGLDGFDIVKKIKADPKTKHIPVVAVTSYPETYARRDAIAAGCEAYLLKPLSTRILPDRLATIVDSRNS